MYSNIYDPDNLRVKIVYSHYYLFNILLFIRLKKLFIHKDKSSLSKFRSEIIFNL
jgi:hypothetical protein